MNKKVIAIIVIVAALVTVCCAYLGSQPDNEDDSLILLSSEDNIKEGLRIEIESQGSVKQVRNFYVDDVSEGIATLAVSNRTLSESEVIPWYYAPGFYLFDYTDESQIPDGVTVLDFGNVYVIDGSYSDDEESWDFDKLTIVYDGVDVTSIKGILGYTYSVKTDDSDLIEVSVNEFSTVDDIVTVAQKVTLIGEVKIPVDEVFDSVLLPFDEYIFVDADYTVTDAKLGGLDVQVYIANGGSDYYQYKNFMAYVYDGHFIKVTGMTIVDGVEKDNYLVIKVFMDI